MGRTGQKLYQQVAAQIAGAIHDGRFVVGARIPGERDLAETYGVSRPTIREAMIALEIRGLVEARHGSGIFVKSSARTVDAIELDVGAFELIEARILFEGEAAALAATVIDDDQLRMLDGLLADMAALEARAIDTRQVDRDFHLAIADCTGNTLVRTTVEMLWDVRERSPLCIHMFAQAQREGVNPRVDEHRLIVDALHARNPADARDAMAAHLRRVTEDILAATELEQMQKARMDAEARRQRITRRNTR